MPIVTETDGFTPVIDSLLTEVGLITAAVYGAVWRYCQMEDRVCRASLDTIASRVCLDRTTAQKHIKKLCELGYLKDLTPDIVKSPHTYADTGKAQINGKIKAESVDKNFTSVDVVNSLLTTSTDSRESVDKNITKRHDSKRHDKREEETTPGPLCQAVLDVCCLKWSYVKRDKIIKSMLANVLEFLTEEEVRAIDIFEFNNEWRKVHHWTGKDRATNLRQIGELWGPYQVWVNNGRPVPTVQNGASNNGVNRQTYNSSHTQASSIDPDRIPSVNIYDDAG